VTDRLTDPLTDREAEEKAAADEKAAAKKKAAVQEKAGEAAKTGSPSVGPTSAPTVD
jgi:septal ring factor EnvC (AmiA/AmiB activator)